MLRPTGFVMPVPSTALVSEVELEYVGATMILRFDYDREGIVYRSGLKFLGVRALQFRGTFHCTPAEIEASYDVLVEAVDSSWVRELLLAMPADQRPIATAYHHYLITLDSTGCFEIVARSWSVLAEERGFWSDKS